jgi:hypothetical protein
MNHGGPRCRSHKLLEAHADAKFEQAIRLKTNDADLLAVGEIEAVTQLAAMRFVNRVLPLTLTIEPSNLKRKKMSRSPKSCLGKR